MRRPVAIFALTSLVSTVAWAGPEPLPGPWSRPAKPSFSMGAATCSSDKAFAVGSSNAIAAFDGTTWTDLPKPPGQLRHKIAATPSGEVYALMDEGLAHFDGRGWTVISMSGWEGPIHGVAALASGDVVVAGHGRLGRRIGNRISMRSAGTWREVSAISGSSLADLWIGGQGGTVLHHTAGGWAPTPTGSREWIRGLLVPTPSVGWAWSRFGGNTPDQLLRWDGKAWSPAGAGLPDRVSNVASDGSHTFAQGSEYVARREGDRWVSELEKKHLTEQEYSFSGICLTKSFVFLWSGANAKAVWKRPL